MIFLAEVDREQLEVTVTDDLLGCCPRGNRGSSPGSLPFNAIFDPQGESHHPQKARLLYRRLELRQGRTLSNYSIWQENTLHVLARQVCGKQVSPFRT